MAQTKRPRKRASSRASFNTIPYDAWMAQRLGVSTLTREVLEAHQLERLNRTLLLARKFSPFYARHLKDLPVFPLQSLQDIRQLPFTTPDDVRDHGASMLCVDQGDISRVVTLSTSGTTGEPKQLQFTPEDQELTLGIFQHSMEQVARPGEACFVFLPSSTPGGVGDLLCKAIAAMGARPIAWGLISDLQAAAGALAQEPSCSVVGIPIQVQALAKYCKEEGLPRPNVHDVLLCTDYVAKAAGQVLRKLWNCPVFEYYGLTEACYAGGMECAAHDGCHLHETDLFVEIVDPEGDAPVPDGQYGEVVITTLMRRGMPLIRYRTGDISRILPSRCRCGSVLRRLEKVAKRLHQPVPLPLGKFLIQSELEEALLPLPWLADFSAAVRPVPDGRAIVVLDCYYLGTEEADVMLQQLLWYLPACSVLPALTKEHLIDLDLGFHALNDELEATTSKRRIKQLEPITEEMLMS